MLGHQVKVVLDGPVVRLRRLSCDVEPIGDAPGELAEDQETRRQRRGDLKAFKALEAKSLTLQREGFYLRVLPKLNDVKWTHEEMWERSSRGAATPPKPVLWPRKPIRRPCAAWPFSCR